MFMEKTNMEDRLPKLFFSEIPFNEWQINMNSYRFLVDKWLYIGYIRENGVIPVLRIRHVSCQQHEQHREEMCIRVQANISYLGSILYLYNQKM